MLKTVLIAPDKFKGSLNATEVCNAIKEGIHSIAPDIHIISQPLADGGEGTMELLTEYSNGRIVTIEVLNPLLNPVNASYGLSADGKEAFIEMARASGLQLLDPADRNPMITSTFGTGQLIQHAIQQGAKHIILGIGGSATNDAGIGMADALGYSFISDSGERLRPIGENLINIRSIDRQLVNPAIAVVRFTVLCDVENTLHGEHGAAYVFGPQKGASANDVRRLDLGLRNFEKVVTQAFKADLNFAGAGAAGGLGAGTNVFLNAEMRKGFDFIAEFTGLESSVRKSDLVITGEGKIDIQSLSGKVIGGVSRIAQLHGKQCVAFAGISELSREKLKGIHLAGIFSLVDSETSDKEAIARAFELLKIRAAEKLPELIFGS